jgi:hypothetical protein
LTADVNVFAAEIRKEGDNIGHTNGALRTFYLLDAFLPPVYVSMWLYRQGYENDDAAQIGSSSNWHHADTVHTCRAVFELSRAPLIFALVRTFTWFLSGKDRCSRGMASCTLSFFVDSSDAWCSLSSFTGAIYLLGGLSEFFGQHALDIFVDPFFVVV